MGERTIRRWLLLKKETASLIPKSHGGGRRAKINLTTLKAYVDAHPDKTLEDIGKEFSVSHVAIWKALRKVGYVYKKTLLYRERNAEKRSEYLDKIKNIPLNDLVYIDESGIYHNDIKTSCWTERGTKIIGERSGKRRRRTSVIAALNGDNINAPIRFSGTANSKLFLYWVENVLLPTLISWQVIIMDNCSIHKSVKVQELIESAGCKLIYLPPYSPDLNPIENYWAAMKNQIKKSENSSIIF